MEQKDDLNYPADELEGFDAFEEQDVEHDVVDDADFQDVSDDLDADVFGDDEQSALPAKKGVNWFNIGVAVVAIAVAGGLLWSKMGTPSMSGSAVPMLAGTTNEPVLENNAQMQQQAKEAAQAAVAAAPMDTPSGEGGMLDNPARFADAATPTAGKMPEPVAIADPFAGVNFDKAAAPEVPMPNPISAPLETQEDVAVLDDMAAAPQPIEQAPLAQPTQNNDVTDASDVASSDLASKVNGLESRLDALDSKMTDALARLETAAEPVSGTVDDGKLSSIQSALERLESRLDTMSVSQKPATRQVSEAVAAPKKAPAPQKTAQKAPSTKKWDAPYKPAATKAQPVSTGGSGGWSLRGAQPGRAVIAKDSDIREVGVGDKVPGLGEITGVAMMNGHWIVQGTQGRISQ